MRYFPLFLVALALSCGAPTSDPCHDASSACVHIQIRGEVGPLDSVQLVLSGAALGQYVADGPDKRAMALPIDVRLDLSASTSGPLTIAASGFSGMNLVGQGSATATVPTSDTIAITLTAPTAAPSLDSISPTSGPTTGQTTLTLRGKGFVAGPGLSVLIGGAPASSVTVISPTEISASLPANPGKAGAVDVVLVTSDNQRLTLPNGFRYYFGTPTFTGTSNRYTVGSEPKGIVVADLNQDSWADMAVIQRGDDTLYLLVNKPNQGAFTTVGMTNSSGAGSFGQRIVAGAFTDKTKVDLVASQDNGLVVLAQGGPLAYPAPYATTTPLIDEGGAFTSVHGIGAADFNKDGFTDVVAVSSIGNMFLYHGSSSGLVRAGNYSVDGGPQQLAVADFDKDSNPDVAVAAPKSGQVTVFLGNGSALAVTGMQFDAGAAAWSVAAADVSGDGKLDLVVANWGNKKELNVLLGNGDGSFGSATSYAISTFANSVAVADFDGDGLADLAAVGYGTLGNDEGYESAPNLGRLVILRNTGQGFTSWLDQDMLGSPQQVVSADFDHNGLPDLAISLFGSSAVQVLLNRSN